MPEVKMTKSLYTAHTFSLRELIRDDIVPFLHSIGIRTRNPFYDENGIAHRTEVRMADELQSKGINPATDENWWKLVKSESVNIVERDISWIDECDGIVALMQEWSGGTVCEIFYTGYICKKPVFLITSNPAIFKHPWMIESCKYGGKIFKTLHSFKKWMRKRYKKNEAGPHN